MALCAWIVYSFLLPTIYSYNLSHLYIGDFNLIVANSPYMVVSDVTIRDTSNFVIDNGVEIIFMDDYTISVYGSFKAGCLDYNTISVSDIRGLANADIFTYIHGKKTSSQIGTISLLNDNYGTNSKSSFCNTKFENMKTAIYAIRSIYSSHAGKYYVDNCEFSNLYNAMYVDTDNNNKITDSYIHNVNYFARYGQFTYDNLLITNFNQYSANSATSTITNSEVIGNGDLCVSRAESIMNNTILSCSTCISSSRTSTITGNTIQNCSEYGIRGAGSINNNTFSNITGIASISSSTTTEVSNNTFIHPSNTKYVIQITGAPTTWKIQNNLFDGHNGESVIYQPDPGPGNHQLDIVQNKFINNINSILLYIYSAQLNIENNTFENNTVRNTSGTTTLIYCKENTNITGNLFLLNEIYGPNKSSIYHQISSYNNRNTLIKYNNFTNNAIQTSTAELAKDSNNLLHIEFTRHNTIEHNVFFNNIAYETNGINSSIITNNIIYSYRNAFRDTIQFNNFSDPNTKSYIYFELNSGGTYNGVPHYKGRFVQYNNFLTDQPPFFIVLDDLVDITASNNYFGGIINIQLLSTKMDHVCDDLNDGFIIFWPYYKSKIQDFANLPPKCTANVASCDFNTNASCETPTISPTQSPTTLRPTESPSSIPTSSPTYIETTNDNKSEMTFIWIIVGSAATILLFAICCGLLLFHNFKRKGKNKMKQQVPLKNMIQSELSNQTSSLMTKNRNHKTYSQLGDNLTK
eukprot:61964_1